MTEPTDPQPQPVTNATTWAAAATAVTGAVLTILEVAGVITSGDRDQLWRVLATAIPTVVGMVGTILAGLHARARVTPLARPKDAAGRPLVVHPAFYGQHAAAPADPLDDWPGAIKATASVPRPVKAAADPPPATYTIVQGDTLWALSQRFGVSVANLEAWNPDIVPTALRIGEVINLQPPDLQGQLDAARAEITRLTATVTGLQTSLTAATGRIASQLATIDEQAARIAELEAELHPKPAPGPAATAWGVNVPRGKLPAMDRAFGGIQVVRFYHPVPAKGRRAIVRWPTREELGGDLGDRVLVYSSKAPPRDVAAGAYDADFEAWCAAAPTDRDTVLCPRHEPENDIGYTLADYQGMWDRVAAIARASGNPRILLAPILMQYTLDPRSKRDYTDWLPKTYDLMGWDFYPTDTASIGVMIGRMKAASARPWFIGEVGVNGHPELAGPIASALAAEKPPYVCYFDGGKNRISTNPAALAAWNAGRAG